MRTTVAATKMTTAEATIAVTTTCNIKGSYPHAPSRGFDLPTRSTPNRKYLLANKLPPCRTRFAFITSATTTLLLKRLKCNIYEIKNGNLGDKKLYLL